MSTAMPVSPRRHTRWPLAILFGVAGALVVGVVVLAFVWPAATAKARDLPVGIGGPTAEVAALEQQFAKQDPDPVAFHRVTDRADAVRQIRDRRLIGAILLGDSPEVLTASAAGSAQNQFMRGVGASLQARIDTRVEAGLVARAKALGTALQEVRQQAAAQVQAAIAAIEAGRTPTSTGSAGTAGAAPSSSGSSSTASSIPRVRITDVVPVSADDATGSGLNATAFPVVLGGMLGGVLVSFLVVGVVRRVLALLVYGAAAGAVVTLVLQTWLHILQRDWLANAAAFGLAMLATAAIVVGFNALLGTRGIAVGAVISLLVGNPISGAAIPYQFIPAPWGTVGQYFVPGAASTLIRSLSYFPAADVRPEWLVLGCWVLGGLLLGVAGHFRSQQPVPLPERELDPVAAR